MIAQVISNRHLRVIPSVSFRPHHFLCTLGFQGEGYSDTFVKNFSKIANDLHSDLHGDYLIQVTEVSDSICEPCPSRRLDVCLNEEKVRKLDEAHQNILKIIPGDSLTWQEAKERIRTNMTLEKFHETCSPCSWKNHGFCERELKRLLEPVK